MFRRRSIAFVAAVASVLVACGGSNDDPVAGQTAPATPTSLAPASVAPTSPARTSPQPTSPVPTGPAPTGPAPTGPEPIAPTTNPVAVPTALDFRATLLDGSEIELGQYAGRPVLLWFWAPW